MQGMIFDGVANGTIPNSILFQSNSLDPTNPHKMNVTYLTNTNTVQLPLIVHSLIVGNYIATSEPSPDAANVTHNTDPNPTPLTSSTAHLSSRQTHNVIVGVVAGSMFVLCIILAFMWRTRLKNRRLVHLAKVAFDLEPFTSDLPARLRRFLDYPNASASEIKTRRRLLISTGRALVIPPEKLRERDTAMSDASSETAGQERAPQQEHTDSEGAEGTAASAAELESGRVPSSSLRIVAIQEEDSGLRNVVERASTVVRLPPVYTPA